MVKRLLANLTAVLMLVACDNSQQEERDTQETPQEGLAAIIALYNARDFETLIHERYTELYKAENEGQVALVIARHAERLSDEYTLARAIDLLESIDPDSVVLSGAAIPLPSETGEMATFSMGDQEYRLYRQLDGKWGFHM